MPDRESMDASPSRLVSLRRHELGRWQAMVRAEAHLLHEAPGALLQQVANQQQMAAAAAEASQRLLLAGRPWLRSVEPPGGGGASGSITLAALAGTVTIHTVFPEGGVLAEAVRRQRVSRGSLAVATLGVWDAGSGKALRSYYQDAPCRLGALSLEADRFLTYPTYLELSFEASLRDFTSGAILASFAGGPPWAFSPDGRLLVGATADGELALRETTAGTELARWAGPFTEQSNGSRLLAVDRTERQPCSFSPDGRWVLVRCAGESVRLLDAAALRERAAFEGARCDGFSPDGRWLLICKAGEARLLDAATLEEAVRWHDVSEGAFSPDGRLLALARRAARPETRLFELGSSTVIATLHGSLVAFAPDGRRLVYGPPARLWDVPTRAPVADLRGGDALFSPRVSRIVFSSDGGRLAGLGPSPPRVWDARSGRRLFTDAGLGALRRSSVAFAPDGSALLSGGEDGTLRLWPLLERAPTAVTEEGSRRGTPVSIIAYASDGELLRVSDRENVVGLSADGEARARSVARRSGAFVVSTRTTGDLCACRAHGEVRFCVFSPDHTAVLSVTVVGEVALWRTDQGPEPRPVRFAEGGAWEGPLCAAFSPDGTLVALGFLAGAIELWSVPLQRCLRGRGLRGGDREPQSCSFGADGRHFAAAHRRGVTVWELRTGAVVAELSRPGGATAVAFTRGRLLAAGSRAGRLWVHRQEDWSLSCETRLHGGVGGLAWSPDGERLAVVAGGEVHVLALTGPAS
ncbi:MAG TPA: hypothetical protein VMS86_14205 [Thermoanaerobaculia bacterium]|nr:hypothetical protein [Thermoanaerobaculia bacterium]